MQHVTTTQRILKPQYSRQTFLQPSGALILTFFLRCGCGPFTLTNSLQLHEKAPYKSCTRVRPLCHTGHLQG